MDPVTAAGARALMAQGASPDELLAGLNRSFRFANGEDMDIDPDLSAFDHRFGGTVKAALELYAKQMREEGASALTSYEAIKDDPEAKAELDRPSESDESIKVAPTAEGLRTAGELFLEQADKSDAAYKAYVKLTEPEE